MVSLNEFKKAMGPEFEKYSDEELKQILNLQEKLADALFDCWIDRSHNSKMLKLEQDE